MKRAFAFLLLNVATGLALAQAPDAAALNDRAIALYKLGALPGAEDSAKQALQLTEAKLGPDAPAVATSLNNLAAIERAQKKYSEAEPHYARALAIREKALGPAHPEVAVTLNNLAVLHDAQDHFEQAEGFYKRALAIREQALPADSPVLAASFNSLGELYLAQRKFERAEPLLLRAYDIRAKAGPKDADFLATQRDLWTIYTSTDRLALAEEYRGEGQLAQTEGQRRRLISATPSPKGNDPTRR